MRRVKQCVEKSQEEMSDDDEEGEEEQGEDQELKQEEGAADQDNKVSQISQGEQ